MVLELGDRLGIEVRLEGVQESDIHKMDEAFLTGTSTQITPIRAVDRTALYEDSMGPVTRRLQEAFLEEKLAVG